MKNFIVNNLSYKIEISKNDEDIYESNDIKYTLGQHLKNKLKIMLLLNDKTPNDFLGICGEFNFDPIAYHQSIISIKNKVYKRHYIFTCTCGDPGCADWFNGVLVDTQESKIIWVIDDKFTEPLKITIDYSQYLNLDKEILHDLINIFNENNNMEYDPKIYDLKEILTTMKADNHT